MFKSSFSTWYKSITMPVLFSTIIYRIIMVMMMVMMILMMMIFMTIFMIFIMAICTWGTAIAEYARRAPNVKPGSIVIVDAMYCTCRKNFCIWNVIKV